MNEFKNINNKYTKIYFKLIERAKSRTPEYSTYYEKHHILPKSLGGKNKNDNIVKLTGREHYIAHLLLWKMFDLGTRERKKMAYAANQMRRLYNGITNSKIYETLKLEHSENVSKDKIGNKNMLGYGRCIKHKKTGKIIRIKLGIKIPDGYENWHSTTKKKLYYYDPLTDLEYRFKKGDEIPKNLIKGRSSSFIEKVKKSSVGNKSNLGNIKIHNPITKESRFIPKKSIIPEGFITGASDISKKRLSKSMKGKTPPNAGKFRYHNEKTGKVIQLFPSEKIPNGYVRGMPPSFSEKTKNGMNKSIAWKKRIS